MYINVKRAIIMELFFIICFVSCQSYPKLANINPSIYEDDNIKMEFVIGEKIYFISVINKSSSEIHLTKKSSVISIDGQTKNLFENADNWFIPPKSTIIFNSNQITIFNQNMYTDFVDNNYDNYSNVFRNEMVNVTMGQRIVRSGFSAILNKTIRLYMCFIINNDEKIYDIPIKIVGIMTKDEIRRNIK